MSNTYGIKPGDIATLRTPDGDVTGRVAFAGPMSLEVQVLVGGDEAIYIASYDQVICVERPFPKDPVFGVAPSVWPDLPVWGPREQEGNSCTCGAHVVGPNAFHSGMCDLYDWQMKGKA